MVTNVILLLNYLTFMFQIFWWRLRLMLMKSDNNQDSKLRREYKTHDWKTVCHQTAERDLTQAFSIRSELNSVTRAGGLRIFRVKVQHKERLTALNTHKQTHTLCSEQRLMGESRKAVWMAVNSSGPHKCLDEINAHSSCVCVCVPPACILFSPVGSAVETAPPDDTRTTAGTLSSRWASEPPTGTYHTHTHYTHKPSQLYSLHIKVMWDEMRLNI